MRIRLTGPVRRCLFPEGLCVRKELTDERRFQFFLPLARVRLAVLIDSAGRCDAPAVLTDPNVTFDATMVGPGNIACALQSDHELYYFLWLAVKKVVETNVQ